MHRPVHFEIQAERPERAAGFYSIVFGWQFIKWEGGGAPYWLIKTGEGPGIDGGLLPRNGPPPEDGQSVNCFVNTMDVESVDHAADVIAMHGGRIVVPKMAIPGVGWLAYAKDTEGNIFGIMQNDTTAQ